MPGPNPQQLVLILCTLPAASGSVPYQVGTGYFIARRLVLTASHVIPEDAVKIECRVQEGTPQYHQAKMPAVWRDDELDAVLVEVSPGLADVTPVEWTETMPEEDVEWRSTGYPIAARQRDDERDYWKSTGLDGTLYAQGGSGQGLRELDLTVKAGAGPKAWGGISGAPVFIGDRIAGIIKEVPDDFSGQRLRGVPAPVLLANARFRLCLAPKWLEWPADRWWALIVLSENATNALEQRVKAALNTFNDKYVPVTGGRPFQPEPVVARITDALDSPERWLQLVQAMCLAPVMVADVTKFQPGVMLTLGVRAVVRRGITITSTFDLFDEHHRRQHPFNIQETKLVCHGGMFQPNNPKNPVFVISEALRDGLLESRLRSRYLDLPAYDAVRCTPPESSAEVWARDSVLVLCSFQDDYSDHYWVPVSDTILTYYSPKKPVRMMDIGSPRLVGQALYEYIRWARTCIVDWTDWRPNVFFELGVRLACSNIGPISLLESSHAEIAEGSLRQKSQLIELFRPAQYDCKSPEASLRPAFEAHEQIVSGALQTDPRKALPHDATYRLATDVFDWTEDVSTLLPHRRLRFSIEDELGRDPQSSGVPPVLFSANSAFSDQLRRSVIERWVAAWYYMVSRYPEELKTDAALRGELKGLGESVLLWTKDTRDPHLMKLRDEVVQYIDNFEQSIAEDEHADPGA
jgi:hypothetical protein